MLNQPTEQPQRALPQLRSLQFSGDPRNEALFAAAADQLLKAIPTIQFEKALVYLRETVQALDRSAAVAAVTDVPWDLVFKRKDLFPLLSVVEGLSRELGGCQHEWRQNTDVFAVMHSMVTNAIRELLLRRGEIVVGMADEARAFVKNIPEFIPQLQSVGMRGGKLGAGNVQEQMSELGVAMLSLICRNGMSAETAVRMMQSCLGIASDAERVLLVDRLFYFVTTRFVNVLAHEIREPLLGRAALWSAVKLRPRYSTPFGEFTQYQFEEVSAPVSRHYWDYVGQRLKTLQRESVSTERDRLVVGYITLIIESAAGKDFIDTTERIFRSAHLQGNQLSRGQRRFLRKMYMVDNGPATQDSPDQAIYFSSTSERFRHIAAARYGLNVRKGYAKAMTSGRWLLEEIAEAAKGAHLRLAAKDINRYPGSGTVLSGIQVGNVLDLSSKQARGWYLQCYPWLQTAAQAMEKADIYFTRGWIAISRSFGLRDLPADPQWRAEVGGERYTAVWFNDHYYNDYLPEVRMWLIPERVFNEKIQLARDEGVDPTLLDLTPEGFAETAQRMGLPILNVGTTSVWFGSFANAWPFGVGEAHSWEQGHAMANWKYQDLFHLHRGVAWPTRNNAVTSMHKEIYAAAAQQHRALEEVVQFFEDLHSFSLTAEEMWAKEYISADSEKPAQLNLSSAPQGPHEDTALGDIDHAPRLRTGILEKFIELRNRVFKENPQARRDQFPRLELQYTRLFSRQEGTASISGADMVLHLPTKQRIPLVGNQLGVTIEDVTINEVMESWWAQEFIARYAPNNCPRIVLP